MHGQQNVKKKKTDTGLRMWNGRQTNLLTAHLRIRRLSHTVSRLTPTFCMLRDLHWKLRRYSHFYAVTFFPIADSTKFCIIFPKDKMFISHFHLYPVFPICFSHASVRRFQEMFHFRPRQQMLLHSNLSRPGLGPIHPPIQTLQVPFLRRCGGLTNQPI